MAASRRVTGLRVYQAIRRAQADFVIVDAEAEYENAPGGLRPGEMQVGAEGR